MEMGRMVMEYCLNAVWLVPVVSLAGWLLVKLARLRPAAEHRLWLAALAVCLALPALGIERPRAAPVAVELRLIDEPQSELPAKPVSLASFEPKEILPTPPTPIQKAATFRDHLLRRLRMIPIGSKAVGWFGWLYAGVVGFAALRIVRVWWATVRLVREASPSAFDEAEHELLRELTASFGLSVPRLLMSPRVYSPVVVGICRTSLLLPYGFDRCSQQERRAALAHELAHLTRQDCLVHATVQALLLPLVWHPAIYYVARRIARTREMACDEMAASAMRSPASEAASDMLYARCLVNLAHTMLRERGNMPSGVGLGLFRTNKLEERVMKLTEVKRIVALPELLLRRAGGVAIAATVLIAGTMVHVVPVIAQETALLAPIAPAAAAATLPPLTPAPAPQAVAVPVAPASPRPAPAPTPAPQPTPKASSDEPAGSAQDVDTDVFADDHFVVARGHNAHVQVPKGCTLHRWVGADGQPYESADTNPGELTAEQKLATEAEFARRMAKMNSQLDAQVAWLKGPAFKRQLKQQASDRATGQAMLAKAASDLAVATAELTSPEFQIQMKKFDSPELKIQFDKFESPEFKIQMDAQLKDLKIQLDHLDSKKFQDEMAKLNSPEFQKQIADAERKALAASGPEMQHAFEEAARKLEAAAARMEAASKALEESQRKLNQPK